MAAQTLKVLEVKKAKILADTQKEMDSINKQMKGIAK